MLDISWGPSDFHTCGSEEDNVLKTSENFLLKFYIIIVA